MKKNPLKQSQYISEKFANYVKSTFVLNNTHYNNDFKNELDNSVLTKGPYLKLELPFQKSYTLKELINKKIISPLFYNVSNIDFNRPLYLHQYKALERLQSKSNIVVTTGTGSGKTEAFLYPILDSLLKQIEENGTLEGIHAILLYPMNALVNDQLERLRKHLNTVPEITFGFFTGDTPERYERRLGTGITKECSRDDFIQSNFESEEIKPPINELLIRKEIRENPPNILITNFSMLEYLLIRPKDSAILNVENLRNWDFMVLDEAHTYRGTLATEVSHLLSRLQAYAEKRPQFILTSATLGNTVDDKKNIIEFAEKLTSVNYEEEDIIYSERISPSIYEISHRLNGSVYNELVNRSTKNIPITDILAKYNVPDLFGLLSQDENVHILYQILETTDTFENVFNMMFNFNESLTEQSFINLINLITSTKRNNLNIYDIKYHFLIRTLEGAFISLGPNPKLRISNRQTIDGMWAFEIGSCKYCNTMYILGKEYNNKLYRSELDLDENYQNFDDLKVDFYLLKDDVIDSLDDGLKDFEEYIVCSKCGLLYQENQHNHPSCECGEIYKVKLLKLINKSKETRTNITVCPVCGKTANKTGIINSFKLGKDQSTALISQILLKSMDLDNVTKNKGNEVSSFFSNPIKQKSDEVFKQFLAFSDSRQQASFFALFLQENQNKFLRKALVLKNLKSKMRVDSIVTGIERIINDKELFTDGTNKNFPPIKNAYVSILLELFKSDGVNSLEGLGLLSFEPDFSPIFEQLSEQELSRELPKIKYKQFQDLLCIFVEKFRTVPAINYDISGLNSEDRKEYLEYRRFDNYMMFQVPPKSGDSSLASLLPVNKNASNSLTKYLKKTFDLTNDEIYDYSEKIWYLLCNKKFLIIELDEKSRGKINFSNFIIYKKEDKKWYQCDKCGALTTHNINNCCVKGDCPGKLNSCDPDIVLANNYYRNEYIEKKIENIVVQEHTGQLTRNKGKEYQKDFKNKKINVLSSSTTFEMGVNIGTLDTVLMRNIPPTNANYAQRSGRAGRSDESVAFVVTYANHNSHDQIYFNNPIPMIEGKINPPFFKLDNNKISIRHIMAHLLSKFYRENSFDDKLGSFVYEIYEYFLNYIKTNKFELEKLLAKAFNIEAYQYYENFGWLDEITKEDSLINKLITVVSNEIDNLKKAEEQAKNAGNYEEAASYKKQANGILNMDIVQGLAKYNVIPGYGFPIDVVPLKIYNRTKKEFDNALNLTRELGLAISEYAPDSEIIVDKHKYTSRYIILPKESDLPKYYYYKCLNEKCGRIKISNIKLDTYTCENCGSDVRESDFIIPNLGFITDEKNKENTILKPRKTYASDIIYLGSLEPFVTDLQVNDFLYIQQTKDDQLLILNENPFFSCPVCGYSVLDKKKADLDSFVLEHKTFRGQTCEHSRLNKIKLGHIIVTDVIKMRINIPMTYEVALSTITAMLNGITSYLQIDLNDINGIITKDFGENYAFIFYDTTYGGAGNVKQLLKLNGLKAMLQRAYESVNMECCDEEVSCTICLRNYKNSKNHKYLKRRYAKETLEEILKNLV